jgi:hypothetical protein
MQEPKQAKGVKYVEKKHGEEHEWLAAEIRELLVLITQGP